MPCHCTPLPSCMLTLLPCYSPACASFLLLFCAAFCIAVKPCVYSVYTCRHDVSKPPGLAVLPSGYPPRPFSATPACPPPPDLLAAGSGLAGLPHFLHALYTCLLPACLTPPPARLPTAVYHAACYPACTFPCQPWLALLYREICIYLCGWWCLCPYLTLYCLLCPSLALPPFLHCFISWQLYASSSYSTHYLVTGTPLPILTSLLPGHATPLPPPCIFTVPHLLPPHLPQNCPLTFLATHFLALPQPPHASHFAVHPCSAASTTH